MLDHNLAAGSSSVAGQRRLADKGNRLAPDFGTTGGGCQFVDGACLGNFQSGLVERSVKASRRFDTGSRQHERENACGGQQIVARYFRSGSENAPSAAAKATTGVRDFVATSVTSSMQTPGTIQSGLTSF